MSEHYEAVKVFLAEIRATIPKNRWGVKPLTDRREYRGQKQFIVGYYWSKLSGQTCYDVVLGWGETPEAALTHARSRYGMFPASQFGG